MFRLSNGSMELELIALIGRDAFLKRSDCTFVVVRGLNVHNDFTCEWDYALGYFEDYNSAFKCFNEKVIEGFSKYGEI